MLNERKTINSQKHLHQLKTSPDLFPTLLNLVKNDIDCSHHCSAAFLCPGILVSWMRLQIKYELQSFGRLD